VAASKDKARAILSYATPNPVGPYRLVTPPTPDLGAGKTKTPIMPVMGGTLVNLPTPVKPTKQTTPVAPPIPSRLVNVPTQQGRVVDTSKPYNPQDYAKTNDIDYWTRTTRGDDVYAATSKQLAAHKKAMAYLEQQARLGTEVGRKYEDNKPAYGGPYAERYAVDRTMQDLNYVMDNIPERLVEAFYDFERNYKQNKDMKQFDGRAEVLGGWLKMMNEKEQDTFMALAKGWSGTVKELADTARSLSK
jgi:hypothetical protein